VCAHLPSPRILTTPLHSQLLPPSVLRGFHGAWACMMPSHRHAALPGKGEPSIAPAPSIIAAAKHLAPRLAACSQTCTILLTTNPPLPRCPRVQVVGSARLNFRQTCPGYASVDAVARFTPSTTTLLLHAFAVAVSLFLASRCHGCVAHSATQTLHVLAAAPRFAMQPAPPRKIANNIDFSPSSHDRLGPRQGCSYTASYRAYTISPSRSYLPPVLFSCFDGRFAISSSPPSLCSTPSCYMSSQPHTNNTTTPVDRHPPHLPSPIPSSLNAMQIPAPRLKLIDKSLLADSPYPYNLHPITAKTPSQSLSIPTRRPYDGMPCR
jgi:hypothetical protein